MTTDILEVRSEVKEWSTGGSYIPIPKEWEGRDVEIRLIAKGKPLGNGAHVTFPQARDYEGERVIVRLIEEEAEKEAQPTSMKKDLERRGGKKQ